MPALDKKLKHDIDVVVDRLVIKPDLGNRVADSMEVALGLTDGIAVAELADKKKMMKTPSALYFQPALPALSQASPLKKLSRVCFPLTIRLALVLRATGWARSFSSTRLPLCPTVV